MAALAWRPYHLSHQRIPLFLGPVDCWHLWGAAGVALPVPVMVEKLVAAAQAAPEALLGGLVGFSLAAAVLEQTAAAVGVDSLAVLALKAPRLAARVAAVASSSNFS